jgi:acetyl-CoA synthetase (ADP-forming)
MSTGASPSRRTLSEAASKQLLAGYGVPFAEERIVATADHAVAAAGDIGFPVVAKLNGEGIAHKTERGLVKLGLGDPESVAAAAHELLAAATPDDGDVTLLVAPMLRATRELIVGLDRDEQFGMTVLLGVGGILAEAIADVSIRLAPIDRVDAEEMIDELSTRSLLGPFRGEPAVDRAALVDVLVGLSDAASSRPDVVSADVNPLLIVDGRPIAVDALVEVEA